MNTPPLLEEGDFETTSNLDRQIWTAAQLQQLIHAPLAASDTGMAPWLQGFSLIGRANYTSPKHVVPLEAFARHYEIIFVEKGTQLHWLDNRLHQLQSGDCLLIPPRTHHSTDRQPENRGRLYWWIFEPSEGLLGMDRQRSELLLECLLRRFRQPALSLSHKTAQYLKTRLGWLFQVWDAAKIMNKDALDFCALLHWEYALKSLFWDILEPEDDTDHAVKQQIQGVCRYIAEHLRTNITLEELLTLTPYSEPHFHRLFRNELGLPPRDYINQEKIILAQKLLEEGWGVTDIAAELEFSSSQYFAVVFRRYAGMSPRDWKKIHKKSN